MHCGSQISQHADNPQEAPPLTLSAVSGQNIQLTSEMLKHLTPEQIYKIYQVGCPRLSHESCPETAGGLW